MTDNAAALEVPLSIADVTDEWLGAALGHTNPGTEVLAIKQTEIIHGSLTKVGLEVEYRTNPHDLPNALYLKAAFEDHGIPVSMRSEALFYEIARPQIEVSAPRCLYAAHDDEHGVVVMEDLLAQGCSMTDSTVGWSADVVADALRQLASLHARWWGEGLVPGIPEFEGSNALGVVLMEGGYWDACIDGPTSEHLPERFHDRERVGRWVQELWRLDEVRPRCFCHGDAHLGNTYVDAGSRPGFLDWGGVKAGHWAREVCYFLVGALNVEDRRTHEADLLQGYLESLDRLGSRPIPSWEEAWLDYRRHVVHGLLWFLCPIQMQPLDVINANVERFGNAATDHEIDTLLP